MDFNYVRLFSSDNDRELLFKMDSVMFLHLVELAALNIINLFHPGSPGQLSLIKSYEREASLPSEPTMDDAAISLHQMLNIRDWPMQAKHELSGRSIYNAAHSGFDLVLQYVDHLNNPKHTGEWMVGDSHVLRQMVHIAVHCFHRWKVLRIEAGIRKDGYCFGSETGFNKIDYTERVADWPEKFKLPPPPFEVLVLSCKRPGFDEARRAESQAKYNNKEQAND